MVDPQSLHWPKSSRSQSCPVKPAPAGGSGGPRIPGAAHHCCWTHCCSIGGGSKAMQQLLHGSCLTWFSFLVHKNGIFPCPCRGVGSGRRQRWKMIRLQNMKIFVCKYLSQSYCPSSSICPHMPTMKGTIDNPTPAIIYSLELCSQAPSAEAETTERPELTHQLAPRPTLCG